jgi:hypothetical protein
MFSTTKNKFIPLLTLVAILNLAGCMIDRFNGESVAPDESELRLAGQIIGESVSESDNGVLSSFSEAFALPTPEGLMPGNSIFPPGNYDLVSGYTYSYDPARGAHQVRFSQNNSNIVTQAASVFDLEYTFRRADGSLIADPSGEAASIESVVFEGRRSGSIETAKKRSFYSRTDQMVIGGLNAASDILTIDGFHSGEGSFTRTDTNGVSVQREYVLDMNFLDIRIERARVEQNRNFRRGVSGALSYESTITRNGQSGPQNRIVNGTLEFNGDGTALLRFFNVIDQFRLRLQNGELFDEDEFEGRVVNVTTDQNTFTLANGQRIKIDRNTLINDDGDYFTLAEVAGAVGSKIRVTAEGDYYRPDASENLWIATEVEFERESNEFEDIVTAVDLINRTFDLRNGDRYFLDEASVIDDDSDFLTLEELAGAIETGVPVEAEGSFLFETATSQRIVREVQFETELIEIEEMVVSVDPAQQSFTTDTGKKIYINAETVFEDDSEFTSLEEVANGLEEGMSIEVDADIYHDPATGFWIALVVNFESN